jgi:hypothetical protein
MPDREYMYANEVDRLTDESATANPTVRRALARYARQPVPPVSRYRIQHALDALCHFAAAAPPEDTRRGLKAT